MQIREHAHATPDKPAVILYPSGKKTVTFGEMEARANQLAHLFRQAGLREGDSVAILIENNEHFHTVLWAARRSGLYYVPINTHLTAAEAAYIIDNSEAKAVVGSAGLKDTLAGLAAEVPTMPPLLIITDGELDGWRSYPECVADQPVTPIDDEIEGDLLQYSSGTTGGRPKGIKRELPHLPPTEVPGMMAGLIGFWMNPPDAVYISPPAPPLYHTAPSVWSMQTLAAGITTVVLEKFDAQGCLDAIARHKVTHGQFVPVMFTRMLKLPEDVRNSYDISSLQRVMHAAAPCPVEIKKQMIDWWGSDRRRVLRILRGHRVDVDLRRGLADPPGSVGKPMMGGLHILDEDGNELPPGQAGEIYFEGGMDFEYLNDAEKTAKSRDSHGWKTVGDIGYLDEEGYLYLTDRRHHMIISGGGVNIYPQEAENMLVTHPKVMDAAVFGVPDEEMGQSVKGVVQLVDSADATEEFAAELLAWLRDRLSHYKCPRSISFESELPPRTDTGKLYKQELIVKYSPAPTG